MSLVAGIRSGVGGPNLCSHQSLSSSTDWSMPTLCVSATFSSACKKGSSRQSWSCAAILEIDSLLRKWALMTVLCQKLDQRKSGHPKRQRLGGRVAARQQIPHCRRKCCLELLYMKVSAQWKKCVYMCASFVSKIIGATTVGEVLETFLCESNVKIQQ